MNYKKVDCDRHVSEPLNLWEKYLPSRFKDDAIQLVNIDSPQKRTERIRKYGSRADLPLLPELRWRDQPLFNNWHEKFQIEASRQSLKCSNEIQLTTNPKGQIESMDRDNIDQAILFPTQTTFLVNGCDIPDEVSAAFATAYNNWLTDYCDYDPNRLVGVAVVSRATPDIMISELSRAIQRGFRQVVLRPEPIRGKTLGDTSYENFWQACEQEGITVAIHGSTHLHGETVGANRYSSRFAVHACSHPMEIQMAFLSLLEGGVLERHPKLNFVFLEAGSLWAPYWLWRLDEIYSEMPEEVSDTIRDLPSNYFKRQCWLNCEMHEPYLNIVIDALGMDRLLYGSDFPHPDHLPDIAEHDTSTNHQWTEEQLRLLYETNPHQCFDLKQKVAIS